MNLGTLTTWISRLSSDVSQTRYSGQYTDASNIAQQQFAMDSKALFKDQAISIVSGTATYSLNTDFMFEKKVTISTIASTPGGKKLIPITRSELEYLIRDRDWTDVTGTPTHYIIDPEEARKQIRLYPVPQAADAGTSNLVITYYPLPTDLSVSTDTPLNSSALLAQFHIAIAAYAAWLLLGSEPGTPEILAKRLDLYRQYQDGVALAVNTFGNTKSAPLRFRGGRSWK